MAEEEPETPAPAPKKPNPLVGKLVNGAGVFVLSLVAVVIGGYINEMLHPRQELVMDAKGQLVLKPPEKKKKEAAGEAAAEKSSKPAIYFAFDPPLIVNFEDQQAVRFLQVTIEIMARDQDVIEAVQKHAPIIRNNLMLLMSDRDYHTLMTRDGKEKLRQEALKEVQSVLKHETGHAGVENLLFTSFVVQ
jgi:flagellar FliL protein